VVKHSLAFGRILFKLAGHILQMTTSYMGYILIMFTHRSHVCECAYASARVIKSSLIYGRILLKFAVNILNITTGSMGYALCMFTHRVNACECACAWFSVRLPLHTLTLQDLHVYSNCDTDLTCSVFAVYEAVTFLLCYLQRSLYSSHINAQPKTLHVPICFRSRQ
jgi:hypothetical protein